MPSKKRLILLSTLTFSGGVLFVPFLISGNPTLDGAGIVKNATLFIGLSTGVVAVTALAGLRFADKLNIAMPLLRNWERGIRIDPADINSVLSVSLLAGTIAAFLTLSGNFFMHPPVNHGGFMARVATTLWASVVTETISHLFVLSGLILMIKNKWAAILVSGLIFVILFHLNASYDPATTIYLGAVNFLAATLTGYLFVKKGFEFAVVTHMTMHFIVLAVNT